MTAPDPSDEARRTAVVLRGEYVRAFVEHATPRPASELIAVRLPSLLTISALVAVGALVVGVFWSLISPRDEATAQEPSEIVYSAVAGWDCRGSTDRGFTAHGRTERWLTVPTGGWGEGGCHGTFETIPMSGRADREDPAQYAVFWFVPTAGRQCSINVYVPSGAKADAAATEAHYEVLNGRDGETYAQFVVDQSAHRGAWVAAGAFPVKEREIAVKITNRGVPKEAGDRIAIAQLRLDCTR